MKAWQLDDSLLPGEDPVHIQEGDVEMWISVYEDLLAGHRRIFQDLQSRDRGPAMELNIQRLEVGLAFWTRQRDRVDAANLPLSKDSSTRGEPSQDPAPGLTQPGPQATALPVARPAK